MVIPHAQARRSVACSAHLAADSLSWSAAASVYLAHYVRLSESGLLRTPRWLPIRRTEFNLYSDVMDSESDNLAKFCLSWRTLVAAQPEFSSDQPRPGRLAGFKLAEIVSGR